ncbi:hypothetical protein [Thioclava atlantica]|uniref:Uncharacterized protein n=1 Tax=Thioclava atlantica TaxID=1317124 RepID=A0A085TZS4_9RHOB|nr:hypothetical protein [Thioclava atlantica]KFE36221.1 hypothetical protein DW2_02884 [Thioclava atlantica]
MTFQPALPSPAGFGPRRPGYLRQSNLPAELGPDPRATLECFVDLGLSDAEIARYFHIEAVRLAPLTATLRGPAS